MGEGRTLARLIFGAGLFAAVLALAASVRLEQLPRNLFFSWAAILALVLVSLALFRLLNGVLSEFSIRKKALVGFFVVPGLVIVASAGFLRSPFAVLEVSEVAADSPSYFIFRNAAIALVATVFALWFQDVVGWWRSSVEAEASGNLKSLQARIKPHFLFNTLNTISSLIHDRPEQAEQATLDLADLLRTGLKDESTHALSDELDLIRGYLRIEQLRLADRLYVEWELADELPLDQQLPPLLLQPLVENTIIHGISRRAEGGTLRIEGQRIRFGRIRFTVTNPLADPDSRPAEGNQSALENIRQRLALAYEERYGLKTWTADGHFIAELTIPVT